MGSTIPNESSGYKTNATADPDPDVIFETQDPKDANEDIPEVQVSGKKVPIATGKKRKCTLKGSDGLLEQSDEQRKAMMQELRDSNIQMMEKMERWIENRKEDEDGSSILSVESNSDQINASGECQFEINRQKEIRRLRTAQTPSLDTDNRQRELDVNHRLESVSPLL
ncbi:hypothetical protein SELMODRAFT_402610 [Selaginella moellendorffii]|uniref:Uncharacterized protein n=1 Tax=Selaginella moellendorffii TaxID=88036 RepID=D8QR79_SELML|nr:hypothetical protein SELMODRAFT_402610 [Selaginella moellendorffii]